MELVDTLPFGACSELCPAHGSVALSAEVFGDAEIEIAAPFTCHNVISPSLGGSRVRWMTQPSITRPIFQNGHSVGVLVDSPSARYLYVNQISPSSHRADAQEQTQSVFKALQELLGSHGMDATHLIRTWYYNKDILDWYQDFNDIRTSFFSENGVISFPASTCVGAPNSGGTACLARALALQPKDESTRIFRISSPLQCEADDYGSQFSRAVLVVDRTGKTLHVSGTASISADGKTQFVGDPFRQVETTMEVVRTLLQEQGMSLQDTSSGICYFPDASCLSAWTGYLHKEGLDNLPVISAISTICRSDLLFEIELELCVAHPTALKPSVCPFA